MKKQKSIIAILVVALAMTFSPLLVQARGLVPCGGYNADGSREPICTVQDAFYLVALAINWLISVAGIYAVIRIIYAGFMLVASQGNEESLRQHKESIIEAIIGFCLVLMAFLFVNTAVNLVLSSKCKIDLRSPLTYLSVQPSENNCKQ